MSTPAITAESLTMAYGSFVVMKDLNFKVDPGSICIIMGGSGCGKSTLLKHFIGLKEPAKGEIFYGEESFTKSDSDARSDFLRKIGVTYQSGALFSSLTLAENVAVPLQKELRIKSKKLRDIASYKLALVGLAGFEDFYPAEISGGMRKRASLARAIALDPDLLFFDEPSAGLDPLSSARLDELILQLRDSLGTTVVIVTHELESIFAIADHCLYLDVDEKTLTAQGSPKELVENPPNDRVYKFLTRNGQSKR